MPTLSLAPPPLIIDQVHEVNRDIVQHLLVLLLGVPHADESTAAVETTEQVLLLSKYTKKATPQVCAL